jgi:hypothetical protein
MDLVPDELAEQASRWDSLARLERIDLAKQLRACGLSLGEVAAIVPMSKPTLSVWCREVELTLKQQAAIKKRTVPRPNGPRNTQRRRRAQIKAIDMEAREFARARMDDAFFVGGVALYWGEGAKTNRRLQLVNSDPRLLSYFIEWVRRYHSRSAQFVLALNLHANNDLQKAERFWRENLALGGAKFTKAFIKPEGTGHRKNHLPHGVCRVTVRKSTDAWIRCLAWIDELAQGGWSHHITTLPLGR